MKLARTIAGIAAAMLLLLDAHGAAKVGEPAPRFTLTDIDGEERSLADYEGKIVVLEWTNYGCPYVDKFYRSGKMQELQGEMTSQDVVWLTICSSKSGSQGHMSEAEWRKESSQRKVQSTAILVDDSGKVGRAYGARVTPHMFVIGKDGELVYNGAIDDRPTTKVEDIDKAENYVRAAVAALQDGRPVATKTSKPYGCGIKFAKDS